MLARCIMHGDNAHVFTVEQQQIAESCFANARSVFKDGFENRLKLSRRRTDSTQYVCRRSLLLKRFAQLAKQPRILDGDNSLCRGVFKKSNLLLSERPDFLTVDIDRSH